MALTYTHVNGNGIFDFLGRLFGLMELTNTASGSTVATAVDAAIDQFKKDNATTLAMEQAISPVPQSKISWSGSTESFLAQWRTAAQGYLRGAMARDSSQPADTLDNALRYLITNMLADGYYVDANAVTLDLAAAAGNTTNDLALIYTEKDGRGDVLQNMLAEAIAIDLTNTTGGVTARFLGKVTKGSLSDEWPGGSGHSRQLSAADPASSLLTNGDFDDMSLQDIPDDWLLLDGLPGTDYLLTGWEVQDVAIAGSPTAGGYFLRYTSPAGPVYLTTRLAYNAEASAVQDALRAIPGLDQVTVTATGTTPNFTHRVTFVGVAGNLTILAAESQLDTGSITPTQITAGDANAYRGRTLKVVGDAAADMRLLQALPTLTPDTVYFVCVRHKKAATPATGTVTMSIVPGYGGAATVDTAGGSNSHTFDLTAADVDTDYTAGWFAIRVKPSQAQPLYLQINVEDLEAGTTYCLDEVLLVQGTQLYAGGPIVAAVQGKAAPSIGDKWTLTATNNRAGEFQTWFDRVFDMRSKGYILPSAGSTNIPDSLIA